jgi:hypothetical protein
LCLNGRYANPNGLLLFLLGGGLAALLNVPIPLKASETQRSNDQKGND